MENEENAMARSTITVRVAPRSSRDAVRRRIQRRAEGAVDGASRGRSREQALLKLLAERLNVPVSAVRIVAGENNRTKRVSIAGVSRAQAAALFEAKPA